MNLIADTHTHTIASTHAYSTLQEMAAAAKRKGLYALGVTDHGPNMPGAPGAWYFTNLRIIPRYLDGVLLLRGIEANIADETGRLDEGEGTLKRLDWVVASMHEVTYFGLRTREACTAAWLAVAKNPLVRVIGHSGTEAFPYDYETVIQEFGREGKLVEVNNQSFVSRPKSISNCKQIALICKKYGVPIVVNSDAHFSASVGAHDNAEALLKEIDFPEELIINASRERFDAYLKQYTHVLDKK